ncbi:uncharacterized protein Z519_01705 [Cladophialophora bantiana CBS 173.52]|uniref:Uncharacterized protein n=1 Tax=Cladophialophora bantiana (strain ATCC 10958 / CBS 173.52 / CDC B-1940 / NIH 8579) TaxID=1442370 RepID=A0A0D2F7P9_CLAB1|nr:uncharacterized protein Z519_01705 [Cladophialophora bantiana CBS 173.52]KIW98121.1 hypothetical protein Z519_01705 [Cladophialophora bantiana CBS 173.52]
MPQQYPYGQASPYLPGQYAPQPQLYPPSQGGSRPASLEHQSQRYPSQDYPTGQPHYPPPQYPPPEGLPSLAQEYQYAPPSAQQLPPPPQQQLGRPYILLFQPTPQKHIRSLTPLGSTTPTNIVTYNRPLIYSSGLDITLIATTSGSQVATVNWHTWSGKIDLTFSATSRQITYKNSFEPTGGSAGGTGAAATTTSLGRLFWTVTRGDEKQADLKCTDRTGAVVCTVVLYGKLRSGKIETWRQGLDKELFEQVVVSAVVEVENWKRKIDGRNSSNPGVIADGVEAALGS